jgi:LDH2 family malate/lactate/ureidoglycolate dehydrogenase
MPEMYVRDVQSKICVGAGTPTILSERAGTAWVDGNNLLGPVVGNFCMQLAIDKARTAGIGWVSAKGSNHYGIAGWYSMMAVEQGMIVRL